MQIKIKKGLDIPIKGQPTEFKGEVNSSNIVALDLKSFPPMRFSLLCKEGESVAKGQPLLRDKDVPKRVFLSPASGKIKEIIRGYKRSIKTILIEKSSEPSFQYKDFDTSSKEKIIDFLCETGLIMQIQMRPFARVAHPDFLPKKIFVRGVESAPYLPSMEMQIEGMGEYFAEGLTLLSKLTNKLHLVYREGSGEKAFTEAKHAKKHTVSGPHPVGLSSVHIHQIDPIEQIDDITWTLSGLDVACIGFFLKEKKPYLHRVISIAGALPEDKIGFYKVEVGAAIADLIKDCDLTNKTLISGDPLMGKAVTKDGFLGFSHLALSVLQEEEKRKTLYFLKPGLNRYTKTRAYGSWLRNKAHWFSSLLHGERRAFIDGSVYDRVMPMRIPTALLIKALLAEDFERAKELGVLEISPEDLALPTFICPSKIEMVSIVEEKLQLFYDMMH